MRWWFAAALVAAFVGLVLARYLEGPVWIDALIVVGGCLGLAVAMAVGMAARRLAGGRWLVAASLVLALAAAGARGALLARLGLQEPPQLAFWPLALAASSVVWGAVALLWGALAISDALQPDQRSRPAVVGAAAAVTVSLYSVAPLWSALGLRINHWTVLGLFGLAAAAYGIGVLYRRIA